MVSMGGEWIYWLVGGLLAVIGGVVLSWAWLWDRSRGRLRCPKCWYGMEGVPAAPVGVDSEGRATGSRWTCPECGKKTLSEGKLRKTRRRRRWAALGLVMLVAAWGVWKFPEARRRGLVSYVPTTILIFTHELAYTYNWGGSDVGGELMVRVYDNQVSSWQLARIAPWDLENLVDTNGSLEHWPAGFMLPVELQLPTWFVDLSSRRMIVARPRLPDARTIAVAMFDDAGVRKVADVEALLAAGEMVVSQRQPLYYDVGGSWMCDDIYDAGTPLPGQTEVLFDWRVLDFGPEGSVRRPKTMWSGVFRLPLNTGSSAGAPEELQPVRSAEMDAGVRNGLVRGIEVMRSGELGLVVGPPGLALNDVTLSVRVELLFEGEPLGEIRLIIQPEGSVEATIEALPLAPAMDRLPAPPTDERLRVRVRPYVEGVVYRGSSTRYWEGEVEIPLAEVLNRPLDASTP